MSHLKTKIFTLACLIFLGGCGVLDGIGGPDFSKLDSKSPVVPVIELKEGDIGPIGPIGPIVY